MGRVFLIKFDQIPEKELYVCSKCRTHIAVQRERSGLHHEHNCQTHNCTVSVTKGTELNGAVFRNAINWHTLGAEQNRRVRDYVVAEVYCNNCGNRLGFQFIEVPKNGVFAVENNLLPHGSKVLVGNANNVVLAENEVNEVDEDEVDANDD